MEADDNSLTMHPPLSSATGNIPHRTPAPWTLTLCIVGSQITVCPSARAQNSSGPCFTLGELLCIVQLHTLTEPIQQPSSHLVCALWHCLWKHVHLALPCLPPLAVVPITHILSPLHLLFSSLLLLLRVFSSLSPVLHPPPPSLPAVTYCSGCWTLTLIMNEAVHVR